jgi:hypothetical protein
MPTKMWQHTCCDSTSWSGAPRPCPKCGAPPALSRWFLATHESMARYQLHYGLKPMGKHGRIAHALIVAISSRCESCNGEGLLDSDDLSTTWVVCPECHGWGGGPLPNDPAIKAMRAEVARQFPDAVVPDADLVGADDLRAMLASDAVIIRDLQSGLMLICPQR